jgi:tetratricopeptide (TPR) repeat protein
MRVVLAAWVLAGWSCSAARSIHVVTLRDALSPDEHVALGVAYEREGKRDLARQEYELALRGQPDHVQALVNLGNLSAQEGSFNNAEGWYRRAVRVGGKQAAPGANNLAWLYMTQGKRLSSAESLARKAVAWDPKLEYVDTLVQILIKAGKPIEAGRAIDDALALAGDDPQRADEVRKMFADETQAVAHLAFEQGKAKLAAGKYDDAELLLREAIRRDGERATDYLVPLAETLLTSNRPDEAVRLIDQGRSAVPPLANFGEKSRVLAQAAHARGKILLQEGQLESAEVLVRGALRWDPSRAPHYLDTLAQVLIAQDKPYEASKMIDEADSLVPVGDAELRARLFDRKAELFTSQGLTAEAKAAAQQAEAIRKAATP